MQNKIKFLKANRNRLNNFNKEAFAKLENIQKESFNLIIHEELDRILESNFSEEELKEYKLKTNS